MGNWVVPYIVFNGNCEEAVKFYQQAFGGEVQILRFGDAPPNPNFPPLPEEAKNRVMHAELRKDGHILRFSDTMPGMEVTAGNNISFTVEFPTTEETERVFNTLAAEGKVEMPLQATFFSPLYGMLTDKFGIKWQILCQHQ